MKNIQDFTEAQKLLNVFIQLKTIELESNLRSSISK